MRRLLVLTVLALGLAAAPAHAATQGFGVFTHNGDGTLTLTVTNTSDALEQIDSVEFRFPIGSGYTVASATGPGGACGGGGSPGYTLCGFTDIPAGQSRTIRVAPSPAPYSDRGGGSLGIYGGGDCGNPSPCVSTITGPEPLPVTAPPPTPTQTGPTPTQDQTQVITPLTGTVLVRQPGQKVFTKLLAATLIKDRSEVDTRKGTARITVAKDKFGGTSTADVSLGLVIVDQMGRLTQLKLSEKLTGCPRGDKRKSRSKSKASRRKPKKRRVFVKSKDNFQTRGNHAAGTVRGTQWTTNDTCKSTTIRVTEGIVAVRDFVKKRTVSVRAPKSYTARARKR
ncbi:MAG: hypothetical protein H0V29_13145 [Thermoleophilaceae bacterium]|nr:hypothetical protein [Thermoleophilaceae bacterium]